MKFSYLLEFHPCACCVLLCFELSASAISQSSLSPSPLDRFCFSLSFPPVRDMKYWSYWSSLLIRVLVAIIACSTDELLTQSQGHKNHSGDGCIQAKYSWKCAHLPTLAYQHSSWRSVLKSYIVFAFPEWETSVPFPVATSPLYACVSIIVCCFGLLERWHIVLELGLLEVIEDDEIGVDGSGLKLCSIISSSARLGAVHCEYFKTVKFQVTKSMIQWFAPSPSTVLCPSIKVVPSLSQFD